MKSHEQRNSNRNWSYLDILIQDKNAANYTEGFVHPGKTVIK